MGLCIVDISQMWDDDLIKQDLTILGIDTLSVEIGDGRRLLHFITVYWLRAV
jgi:hypothetical protein